MDLIVKDTKMGLVGSTMIPITRNGKLIQIIQRQFRSRHILHPHGHSGILIVASNMDFVGSGCEEENV